MSDPVLPSIPVFEKEWRRVAAKFREMPGDEWEKPSFCGGWSKADALGHMTLGSKFYTDVLNSGLEGRVEPAFGAKSPEEFNILRTSIMKELAALPLAERMDRFEANSTELEQVFRRLTTADLEKNAWHRFGACPIRFYPIARLYEVFLHEWDIGNDPAAPLAPGGLDAAMAELPWRFEFFYGLRKGGAFEGRVRLRTDDAGDALGLAWEGGKAVALPGDADGFTAEISASRSDLLLLTAGRADAREKEAAGALRIEGDRAAAETVLGVLSAPF